MKFNWWNDSDSGKLKYPDKPVPVPCCLSESPHGLTWGKKQLGLGSEKLATNCLSHVKDKRSDKNAGWRMILICKT
jgi:hypothetical protein